MDVAERQLHTEKLNYRTLGSSAYEVHVPQRVPVRLPEERSVPKPVRKVQVKTCISPITVAGIAVAAFLAILVLFCYVRIYETNTAISALNTQLKELEETRVRLEGQYKSQTELLQLEAYADRYGLQKPTQEQIVYLDLSGADHADITPVDNENVFIMFFTSVFRSVRDFLEYLS